MLVEHTNGLVPTLRAALGSRLRVDEPLARHTSMRVGGPADVLAMPESAAELAKILAGAAGSGVRVTLLGGGSNVLVGDGGIRGVVVKLGRGLRHREDIGGTADAHRRVARERLVHAEARSERSPQRRHHPIRVLDHHRP